MDIDTYQTLAMRTAKLFPTACENLVHAALGATSECGELSTTVKAHVVYGTPIDGENVKEEIGDAMWYLALAAKSIGLTLSQCAKANIERLERRYPEKYTDQDAVRRADK